MSETPSDHDIEATVRAAAARLSPLARVLDCDPALADTAEFCAAYGYTAAESVNTILVVGKSDPPVFAACLVRADSRLDVNGAVRRRLGVKKASFASPDDTVRLTGMMIGGVTPLALPADLPVWIDAAVADNELVIVGGGSRSIKVHLPPTSLLELPGAEFVEGLAKPLDPA